jgi:hypothetical protein
MEVNFFSIEQLYISGDLRDAAQLLLETHEQFPFLDSCDSPWRHTVAQILFEHFLNMYLSLRKFSPLLPPI